MSINSNLPEVVTIRLRRDTSANWVQQNPVLKLGEPGLETDTRKIKFGNGTANWNNLQYVVGNDIAGIPSNTGLVPNSASITNIVSISQANYDALVTKDSSTLYVIS
jgi:hypothetical protein